MLRAELIRMFVLNSFCDDYEDIEQITKHTDEVGPKCGLTISREDIIQALGELVELGFAKAWDLTQWGGQETTEYFGRPDEEISSHDPRFSRTAEGLAFQKVSSTSGPFDQDPSLRQGELVRSLVLDTFQNCTHVSLCHIERHVAERHGVTISRDEFIRALGELIRLGYLKASYKGRDFLQYDGMPPLQEITPFGAYFWVTGKGLDFHNANDSWWPFEEDDGELRLRKDWTTPDA